VANLGSRQDHEDILDARIAFHQTLERVRRELPPTRTRKLPDPSPRSRRTYY